MTTPTRLAAAGILVTGLVMAAGAQRRPAAVENPPADGVWRRCPWETPATATCWQKMDPPTEPSAPSCEQRAQRLDAERFEALRRVALLRGALKRLRRDMTTAGIHPWPGDVPPAGSIYREVYDAAAAALAADDKVAGGR